MRRVIANALVLCAITVLNQLYGAVGPCSLPSCSDRTFTVTQNGDGTTSILIRYGPQQAQTTVSGSSTTSVGAFGICIWPGAGMTWEDIDECSDILGRCQPC